MTSVLQQCFLFWRVLFVTSGVLTQIFLYNEYESQVKRRAFQSFLLALSFVLTINAS